MSFFIEDGTGKGFKAQVDSDNKLVTRSVSQTREHELALEGNTYFAHSSLETRTHTITDTEAVVADIQNTSTDKKLIIQQIILSTDTAGTLAVWQKNHTFTSPANYALHTPVNSNTASTNTAPCNFYVWDGVGSGITGVDSAQTFTSNLLAAGTTIFPLDGTVVIPPGGDICIHLKAPTGQTSECTFGWRFYVEDD